MVVEGELDDHLDYAKHDPAGRNGGNSRKGHRDKTVLTEAGPVELSVPRDRDASFEPRIVAKKQRWLTGIDDLVISLLVTPDGDLPRCCACFPCTPSLSAAARSRLTVSNWAPGGCLIGHPVCCPIHR